MIIKVVNIYKCKDGYDVYIGRSGKGKKGTFGNPVVPGKTCFLCKSIHIAPASTLPCYERYLTYKIQNDEEFQKEFLQLVKKARQARDAGRTFSLACFCSPSPCHGNVLARFVKRVLDSTPTGKQSG